MKFEKNKIYDGIFLSDVHYLLNKKIKSHKHKELFQFLDHLNQRNVRFKNIYLVGDIIENWFFSASRKLKRSKKNSINFSTGWTPYPRLVRIKFT